MFKRIIVPLDGTKLSRQALPYAVDMAKKYNATLLLVSVIRPEPIYTSGLEGPASIQIMADNASRVEKQRFSRSGRYLDAVAQSVSADGVRAISKFVVRGAPSDEIAKIANDESADVIIMTTHARSGIRRAWLGSVADALIRNSGVPVLVIRPKGT